MGRSPSTSFRESRSSVGAAAPPTGSFLMRWGLLRAQRSQRSNDLCPEQGNRLEDSSETIVIEGIQSFRFVVADVEHTRQTRPGFNVRHSDKSRTARRRFSQRARFF